MHGVDTGIQLSVAQCLEISRQAVIHGFFYTAIEWAETALAKLTSNNVSTEAELKLAQLEVETAKQAVDQYHHKLVVGQPGVKKSFLFPYSMTQLGAEPKVKIPTPTRSQSKA